MTQITISIPTPLRVYTEQLKKIKFSDQERIATALDALIEQYPKLRNHLYDGGQLRNFVNIYLNDEDIRYLEEKEQTSLNCGDNLSIIPALAGGTL
ncbi:MAG: MoaD/ThiS family protein [Candidatus Heimdallarchaeota archaeon]|nr:MoaD/ThiS family protein [Candidatus Heimdallarchaeota archaeon]